MPLSLYLVVMLGGAIGSLGRYGISVWLSNDYLFDTLTVNLIGSFLLAYLLNHTVIQSRLSPKIRTALGTGLIGSFTTYSTFSIETLQLWMSGSMIVASLYVVVSIVGSLSFCWAGFKVANWKEKQA